MNENVTEFLEKIYALAKTNADVHNLIVEYSQVPEGDLIGWKMLAEGIICKLLIPADAKRVGAPGQKCRAEYAVVLEGNGSSLWDKNFKYAPGIVVRSKKYDPNPLIGCSHGIHFFLTREEAVDWADVSQWV